MDIIGTIIMCTILLIMFFGLMAFIATVGLMGVLGWGLVIGGVIFGVYALVYM